MQSLPISSASKVNAPLNLIAVTKDVVIPIIYKLDPKKITGCELVIN